MVARALQVRVSFDRRRFGSDFRAWRKRERLSMRHVERMIGVSQSHLSKVERGETSPRGNVMACLIALSSQDLADYCVIERDDECQS